MASAWQVFRECGFGAWLVVLASMIAFVACAVALLVAALRSRAAKAIAFVALAIALTPALLGLLARAMALRVVDAALAGGGIDPSQAALIRAEGEKEAGGCLTVGVAAGVVPIVLAGVALALAFALRPKVVATR